MWRGRHWTWHLHVKTTILSKMEGLLERVSASHEGSEDKIIRSTTRLVLRAVIVKGGAELELAWSVYFPSLILSSFPRRVSGLSLTDFVLLLLHIETEPVEVFSATGLDFSWQSSIIALPIVPTGGSVAVDVSNANMWTCCFSTSSTAHLHQIIPRPYKDSWDEETFQRNWWSS